MRLKLANVLGFNEIILQSLRNHLFIYKSKIESHIPQDIRHYTYESGKPQTNPK